MKEYRTHHTWLLPFHSPRENRLIYEKGETPAEEQKTSGEGKKEAFPAELKEKLKKLEKGDTQVVRDVVADYLRDDGKLSEEKKEITRVVSHIEALVRKFDSSFSFPVEMRTHEGITEFLTCVNWMGAAELMALAQEAGTKIAPEEEETRPEVRELGKQLQEMSMQIERNLYQMSKLPGASPSRQSLAQSNLTLTKKFVAKRKDFKDKAGYDYSLFVAGERVRHKKELDIIPITDPDTGDEIGIMSRTTGAKIRGPYAHERRTAAEREAREEAERARLYRTPRETPLGRIIGRDLARQGGPGSLAARLYAEASAHDQAWGDLVAEKGFAAMAKYPPQYIYDPDGKTVDGRPLREIREEVREKDRRAGRKPLHQGTDMMTGGPISFGYHQAIEDAQKQRRDHVRKAREKSSSGLRERPGEGWKEYVAWFTHPQGEAAGKKWRSPFTEDDARVDRMMRGTGADKMMAELKRLEPLLKDNPDYKELWGTFGRRRPLRQESFDHFYSDFKELYDQAMIVKRKQIFRDIVEKAGIPPKAFDPEYLKGKSLYVKDRHGKEMALPFSFVSRIDQKLKQPNNEGLPFRDPGKASIILGEAGIHIDVETWKSKGRAETEIRNVLFSFERPTTYRIGDDRYEARKAEEPVTSPPSKPKDETPKARPEEEPAPSKPEETAEPAKPVQPRKPDEPEKKPKIPDSAIAELRKVLVEKGVAVAPRLLDRLEQSKTQEELQEAMTYLRQALKGQIDPKLIDAAGRETLKRLEGKEQPPAPEKPISADPEKTQKRIEWDLPSLPEDNRELPFLRELKQEIDTLLKGQEENVQAIGFYNDGGTWILKATTERGRLIVHFSSTLGAGKQWTRGEVFIQEKGAAKPHPLSEEFIRNITPKQIAEMVREYAEKGEVTLPAPVPEKPKPPPAKPVAPEKPREPAKPGEQEKRSEEVKEEVVRVREGEMFTIAVPSGSNLDIRYPADSPNRSWYLYSYNLQGMFTPSTPDGFDLRLEIVKRNGVCRFSMERPGSYLFTVKGKTVRVEVSKAEPSAEPEEKEMKPAPPPVPELPAKPEPPVSDPGAPPRSDEKPKSEPAKPEKKTDEPSTDEPLKETKKLEEEAKQE